MLGGVVARTAKTGSWVDGQVQQGDTCLDATGAQVAVAVADCVDAALTGVDNDKVFKVAVSDHDPAGCCGCSAAVPCP